MVEVTERTRFHRWEMIRYSGGEVNVELSARFVRTEPDQLTIELEARYTSVRNLLRRELLAFTSATTFAIHGLDAVSDFSDNELLIPEHLAASLMGIALGGLRGMIALRTADTFLANFPLPIVNLRSLVSNMLTGDRHTRGKLPVLTVEASLK